MTYTICYSEEQAQRLAAKWILAGRSAHYLTMRPGCYEVRSW